MIRSLFIIGAVGVLTSCNPTADPKPAQVSTEVSPTFAEVYVTADSSNFRLSLTDSVKFDLYRQPLESEIAVFVDPTHTFQSYIGIGGAITDASAETFAKLGSVNQQRLLDAYYDSINGIGYTIARTHINSCDFSSGSYTYVTPNDKELTSFDISHDKEFRIPLIKKAIDASRNNLTIFVSPWSPPAWMKDNNDMLHGGKLLPEFRQSWADYYIRFINAYEKEGIPIWGLTVQNEPMATQKWESCIYSAEDEMTFVKNFLGPTLKNAGMSDKRLIVWDHNRDLLLHRASTIFNDPEANQYVWGIGFHWYEDWSGGRQMVENIGKVNQSWPDKHLIFTEGCNGPYSWDGMSDWELGERYGRSMISDFNNGVEAWTDWNILLDETGGPNHVKNFCFAPVHANTAKDELIFTNAFYYIGHFSKFIKPGAKRILCSSSRSQLMSTAFQNPDGEIVVVVMNDGDRPANYLISVGEHVARTTALPHSMTTLIVK